MNRYKIAWDMLMSFLYLTTYINDPLVIAFRFTPYSNNKLFNLMTFINTVIILDIFLNLLTAIRKEDSMNIISTYNLKERSLQKLTIQ